MEVSRVYMIIVHSPDVFSLHVLRQLQEVVFGDNNYIALVTGDNHSIEGNTLFNSWLKCVLAPSTPPTPLSRQPKHRCITEKELNEELNDHLFEHVISSINVPQDGDYNSSEVVVSDSIHNLLDNNPWSNEYYVLMNTIVIVPKSPLVNDIVELYGALLRARTWNNSSIYCVTCEEDDSTISNTSITWNDLSTSLPAFIGPMDLIFQTLSRNIVWKGPILIREYKTESCPSSPSLVLHGLQISIDTTYPMELCQAVGMEFGHTHQPSYLELVQVVDVIDIPSVRFSPLTVTLSIDPSFEHNPSANLLNQLFFSATAPSAILVRLFMKGLNEFQTQQCENTTNEWHSYILEKESPNGILLSSNISCSSDVPGPLLLILPSNRQTKSCDARLLWKPEILSNVTETFEQLILTKARKIDCEETSNDIRCDPPAQTGQSLDHHVAHMIDPPPVPMEIIALRTLETITRRKVKRKSTSELMLGGVVAPPMISVSTIESKDFLDCFTDTGMSTRDLSPVAMNNDDGLRSLHMIIPSEPSGISYKKVLGGTPRTARRYHGVNYCLTDDDILREKNLTDIQNHYVTGEQSSNCFKCPSPPKGLVGLRHRKKSKIHVNQTESGQTDSQTDSQSKEGESMIRKKRLVRNRTRSTTEIQSKKLMKNTHIRSKTVHSKSSQSITVSKNLTESKTKADTISATCNYETFGKRKRKGRLSNDSNRENQSDSVNVIATKHEDLSPSHKKRKESVSLDSRGDNYNIEVSDGDTSSPCHTIVTEDEGVVTNTDDSVIIDNNGLLCDKSLREVDVINCDKKKSVNDLVSSRDAKKLLEKSVVNVLKDHGLTKGHPRFNKCYIRLFKICKIYVMDLQTKSLQSLKKEISKIVESNIQQVIHFELQQNYTSS